MHWRLTGRLHGMLMPRPRVGHRFAGDRRGVIGITFALSLMLLVVAVGSGIDLQRAYTARQKLSAVATSVCQFANRPIVVMLAFGSGGASSYVASVNSFYTTSFAEQLATWTQTTAAPFTYTTGGAGQVTLAAAVPTTIMQVIGVSTIPVSASQQCFTTLTSVAQPVQDSSTTMLVNEGFENATYTSSIEWYLPNGTIDQYSHGSTTIPATNTALTTAGYVGLNGNEWIIMGYCLEVDYVGKTQTTAPQGTHSAELDCDNGGATAGNSSISTKVYMVAGTYELRWDYAARIANTYYGTSYVCGTSASDTSWATDTSYSGGYAAQTDQLNVYLDQNTTGSPPTHKTLDGTQTLAGSNLIDQCTYSSGWIERSVVITVTTPGFYWLSLAADGASDSYGGDIDNIRLCVSTCPGTLADNFPPSWLPANNGGNNATLFEDTFESPSYSNGSNYNTNGDVGTSTGSSSFWGETGHGWANAPTNQLPYWNAGCPQGSQCVELGWNTTSNSLISRPFLLVPGYYQISYDYVSEVVFGGTTQVYYCGSTPSAAQLPTSDSSQGTDRVSGVAHTSPATMVHDTNAVGVFMANAQVASTPIPSTTLGSTTSYNNPDGTTSTTPTVPPNAISLSNYTASTTSPLLDICGYATTAQTRTVSVHILKSAFYWLTLSALGTVDGFGGQVDDVRIVALGSPYMTSAPSSPVTIPVPNPQPGSKLSFTGFSIPADVH